ncbi:MAG: hypothetical protein DMG57_13025 [Acidobacteria bacterium]|nr:MAG: hypothetical protein DMG57_13025 [Acidobacteriota bacterium]
MRLHYSQGRPQSIEITAWRDTRALFALSTASAGLWPPAPAALALCAPVGYPHHFCYAPRRVACAEHGVVVEHIPWSDGKRPVTGAMMGFLARWARRLSWRETARAFQTGGMAVLTGVPGIVKAKRPRLHGFIKKVMRSYRYCLTTSVSVSSPLV